MKYRPEIDGMRAIAVLLVVFYHAGFKIFPGGYIGVDVFFVISGYLITRIIVDDLNSNCFSLDSVSRFYERRFRRILPPLFLILTLVFIYSYFYLSPTNFYNFGQSLSAVAIVASNILFYSQSGYWEPAASTIPLLHTWSLAVEEQFYIIIPVLLFWLYRKRSKATLPIMLVLAAVSLITGQMMIRDHQSAVFYLLPFRAWEILLGCILALLPHRPAATPLYLTAAGITGLALIICPAVLYTSETRFPAIAALPPCLGSFILIYIHSQGTEKSPIGKMLSLPVFIYVGKLSYSLYLWHWPLFTLYKLRYFKQLSLIEACILTTLSIALSALSYHLIEQPVRTNKIGFSRKRVFACSFGFLFLFFACGMIIQKESGMPQRIGHNSNVSPHIGHEANDSSDLQTTGAPDKPLSFMLWGDSHAMSWVPAVQELSKENGVNGVLWLRSGCRPVLDQTNDYLPFNGGKLDEMCHKFNLEAFEVIEKNKIKHIIISAFYFADLNTLTPFLEKKLKDRSDKDNQVSNSAELYAVSYFLPLIKKMLDEGLVVWLVEPVPHYDYNVSDMLIQSSMRNEIVSNIGKSLAEHENEYRPIFEMYSQAEQLGAKIIRLTTSICPDEQCLMADAAGFYYVDEHHLSLYGVIKLKHNFVPAFEEIKHGSDD